MHIITTPVPCSGKGCKERDTRSMVFIGNKGYGVCKKHKELFYKVGQLILGEWEESTNS